MQAEHERLLREGWRLCEDGCYRRPEPCDHKSTFSFGCSPGITRCDKCGKMFGVLNIDAEVLA